MMPTARPPLVTQRRAGAFALAGVAAPGACGGDSPGQPCIATNKRPGYWTLIDTERQGRLDARLQEFNSATEVPDTRTNELARVVESNLRGGASSRAH